MVDYGRAVVKSYFTELIGKLGDREQKSNEFRRLEEGNETD